MQTKKFENDFFLLEKCLKSLTNKKSLYLSATEIKSLYKEFLSAYNTLFKCYVSFYSDLILIKSEENSFLFSADFNRTFFISHTVDDLLKEKNIKNSQFDMQKIGGLLKRVQKNYSVTIVNLFFYTIIYAKLIKLDELCDQLEKFVPHSQNLDNYKIYFCDEYNYILCFFFELASVREKLYALVGIFDFDPHSEFFFELLKQVLTIDMFLLSLLKNLIRFKLKFKMIFKEIKNQ